MDNLNIITPSTSKSPPVTSKTSMMMLDRSVTSKPTITLMSPKTSPTTNNHVTKVTVENHCLQDRPDPPPSSEDPNHVDHNSFLCRQHSKLSVASNKIENCPNNNNRFPSLTENRDVPCPRKLSNVSMKPAVIDNSNKIHPHPIPPPPPPLGLNKDNKRETSEIININCNDDFSPEYMKGN